MTLPPTAASTQTTGPLRNLGRFALRHQGWLILLILLALAAVASPTRDGNIVFQNAYAPAASTGHSVYAMLTSTYPFLAEKQGIKGIVDQPFRVTDSTPLMAELLAPAFSHRTGISANPWFGPEFGLDRGFTHFYEVYDTSAVPDSTKRYGDRTLDLFRQDLPCTFVSNAYHKRYRSRQLNLGYPTAHMRIHLMLLPSGPDMVHGFILHRTEIFKHYVLRADFTKIRPQQRN